MSLAWPSLDGAMPAVDLANVAERAMSMASATAMWSGAGVVGLGFLVRVLGEAIKSSTEEGYTPRYLKEILIMVGFVAVMASYKPVVLGTVGVVSRLGSGMGNVSSLEKTFSNRMAKFGAYINHQDLQNEKAGWTERLQFNLDGIVTRIFQLATMFLYIGVQCVMFIIKAIQIFALAAIITYGPILIGASSLGGIFASLGIAWFWALVEVSAWSFTIDILLHVFANFGSSVPEHFSYVQEIIIAMTLMALLVATIPLTGSLIRGQGTAALAHSTSHMAGRMMSMAGMVAGAAGAASGAVASRRGASLASAAKGKTAGGPGGSRKRPGEDGGPPPPPSWMGDKVQARQNETQKGGSSPSAKGDRPGR